MIKILEAAAELSRIKHELNAEGKTVHAKVLHVTLEQELKELFKEKTSELERGLAKDTG